MISEARKRRSLSAVYSRHHERRQSVRFGLRTAMAACMLLVTGAATAAVFGVRWMMPAPPARAGGGRACDRSLNSPHRARPGRAGAHRRARAAGGPAAQPETAPSPPSPPRADRKSEDPSLVVSAIQALRQDHDPERAGRLLAAFSGPTRAERWPRRRSRSIEAADARHNPAAATFAQRYLKEYPRGRFRSVAERVLARPAL